MTCELFSDFNSEDEEQLATNDFYLTLKNLRDAAKNKQPSWAEYPNYILYSNVCFWAIRKREYGFITNWFTKLEKQLETSIKVLDVGCGVVPLCNWISSRGHAVTAIDPLKEDIDFLIDNNLNAFYGSEVEYLNARAEKLPFKDASFDIITFVSCLEHIAPGNDRVSLLEIARVIKPGGYLLITFDVAPQQQQQADEKEKPLYQRQFAYPFSINATRHLFDQISDYFDITPITLPPEFENLTLEQVHDFWQKTQLHDERTEPIREYLAMGLVLQRTVNPVNISFDYIEAAYIEGQTAIEGQLSYFQTHAKLRHEIINELAQENKLLRSAANARLQDINSLEDIQKQLVQENELLRSAADARLKIIDSLVVNQEQLIQEFERKRTETDTKLQVISSLIENESAKSISLIPESNQVYFGYLDKPRSSIVLTSNLEVAGWIFSTIAPIANLDLFIDNRYFGKINYGIERPDVYQRYNHPNAINSGFQSHFPLSEVLNGNHLIVIRALDAEGNRTEFSHKLKVVNNSIFFKRFLGNKNLFNEIRPYLVKKLFGFQLGVLYQYPHKTLKIPTRYYKTKKLKAPPLITIVTPSYNHAEFIERTIKSVLDQQYPKLEYIIQDGGSSDNTVRILKRYSGQLTRWESAKDKGQAHAINLGFQNTNGEIMAYLNSDDLLLPGTLAYVAQFFIEHPQVDVVYGQRVIINEYDREVGRWILPPHRHGLPIMEDILSWADYIPQETLFWRRSLWEKVGGKIDENFQFAMDWELLLRFRAANATFARLPRFLGAFRVHTEQKSQARINDIGAKESSRLREQYIGRNVSEAEIYYKILPYLKKHIIYHKLYRLGILRY
ncbi:MAG: glycosyltransferase [Chloroflexi bacterium]|uniref:Glycosyltransferase n=1 Tax=Candidatus Chlorohelix allophototropha TaxID=3003348 RepID=A0A8T7LZR6_9CHLR|nr:glycosyltransferase [Chloroflexota bacterium]WJW65916.1 glycosyltransferase [Chloroflexota bacterium L227-S17]